MKTIQYINLREVLSRILRHPLLQEVSLESVIQYTIDFIGIFGLNKMYTDKEIKLTIEDYRCILPCDIIAINQIKECKSGICLRSMTDMFKPDENRYLTFKTQGNVLYTGFKNGDILMSYKSIPVDDEGFPLLIDNPIFLKCLELYIKKEAFGVLFDMGKINNQVLQKVENDYAWMAGKLQSELTLPSVSEMQSICNMWTTLIQRNTAFYDGFKNLGNL